METRLFEGNCMSEIMELLDKQTKQKMLRSVQASQDRDLYCHNHIERQNSLASKTFKPFKVSTHLK